MVDIILLGIVGIIDVCVFIKLQWTFRRLRMKRIKREMNDLPSVSVCIAARNETHMMTQCLERLVASDYPKLEIIVLDDESKDNTSVLIKSFAHAGVRFVEGSPLPDGWLGKNHAQAVLADEASGKLILFLDVDTLVERHTIMKLVQYYVRHKARMVSVIPMRRDKWDMSLLFTTMRHFWTIMRFRPKSPRAAANSWLVDRETIVQELETNERLALTVQLETTLARKLAKSKEYRLLMSSRWLGLSYEKLWPAQIETSVRLLYPQANKNSIQVAWIILVLMMTLTPYVLVWWYPWMLGAIAAQFFIAMYYLSHVWPRYALLGALILPATIIQEIILLIASTYCYNFGTITWKGRPITNAKK